MTLPPLALYVHIPWCVRKCPYCDFNSHAQREALPEAAYVAALLEDLDTELADGADRPLGSIFIGGGTPSLFSARAIHQLLEGIARRLTLAADIEITMEANPGTFEQQRFADYRAAGVQPTVAGDPEFFRWRPQGPGTDPQQRRSAPGGNCRPSPVSRAESGSDARPAGPG